jgi:hypothetical protein
VGQKLSPTDNELYRRCDEVLHYLWDPIGVRGIPQARDEYDSYLPAVFQLLKNRADERAIVDYLIKVEGDNMGLSPEPERAREVASVFIDFREYIYRDAS